MDEIAFDSKEKKSFLQKIIKSFHYGKHGPYPSFQFDIYLGGIKDAIFEAKKQHKILIVYIYCKENYNTDFVNSILNKESISSWIRKHTIFYANDITSVEGWKIATEFKYEKNPIFAIVQPNGENLRQCNFFLKHEGIIGEAPILSYLSLIQTNDDNELILQQDEEYLRAVQEASENNDISIIQNEINQEELSKIEKEFEELPIPNEKDAVTIKFNFPDNTNKIYKFPKKGETKLLFIFVRKFVFPKSFNLLSGFPLKELNEDNNLISCISPLNNFVVIVDIIDI